MAEPPVPPLLRAIAARDPELRHDLEQGLRFTHLMGDVTRREVYQTAVSVFALIDEMLDRGEIAEEALDARAAQRRSGELKRIEEHMRIRIEPRVDKYQLEGADIDCDARIPLCRARCCTLHFPLSLQDLDERVVKWNYLQPYVIRQRVSDGYCVHNDPTTKGCTVYHHRPAVCRTYDCRKDKRIWVDFEKRIPAIDPALEPRLVPVPHGDPPNREP